MKIIETKNFDTMSALAADVLLNVVKDNPNANICVPTGGTVEGTYEILTKRANEEGVSFKGITSFSMDEYATFGKDNPDGYYYFVNKRFYSKVDIDKANTHVPQGDAADLEKAAAEYTKKVEEAGGFDFILLGIGHDGHVAFNMPRATLQLDTHVEDLSPETIAANARFFDSENSVPRQALTIGVGMITRAKKIVLIASGKSKSAIIGRLVNQRCLDPMLPASVLWLHNDATLIIDEEAASEIKK